MKKLKKLKLKKESILSLDKGALNNIRGGADFTLDVFTCTTVAIDSVVFCPNGYYTQGTNAYCGTLNDCGTGATFCVTNDCFFNTKPCYP